MRQVTVAVLCVLLWMVSPWPSYAEELVSREAGLDVTFVSDCSGSMRTNDSKGIGREMVEAFVDTVYPGDIRIGYVAYNDTIVTSTAPVPISEQAQRQKLKGADWNRAIYRGYGHRAWAFPCISAYAGRRRAQTGNRADIRWGIRFREALRADSGAVQ